METEKNGIPRFALSEPSIGSTTIRHGPSPSRMPTSSETIVAPSTSRRRSRITRSAAASTAVVSSPPWPSPTTGSRSTRVGRSARTPCTSSTAPRQSASQSLKGQEQETGDELGIEVGALLGHRLAALGDREHVLDPGRTHQHRDLGLARVHRAHGLVAVRRVADALVSEPVDERDVELSLTVDREAGLPVSVDDGGGAIWRNAFERRERRLHVLRVFLCG